MEHHSFYWGDLGGVLNQIREFKQDCLFLNYMLRYNHANLIYKERSLYANGTYIKYSPNVSLFFHFCLISDSLGMVKLLIISLCTTLREWSSCWQRSSRKCWKRSLWSNFCLTAVHQLIFMSAGFKYSCYIEMIAAVSPRRWCHGNVLAATANDGVIGLSERMFDVSLRLEPAVFHACLSEAAEARQSSRVNATQAFVSSFTWMSCWVFFCAVAIFHLRSTKHSGNEHPVRTNTQRTLWINKCNMPVVSVAAESWIMQQRVKVAGKEKEPSMLYKRIHPYTSEPVLASSTHYLQSQKICITAAGAAVANAIPDSASEIKF